MKRVSIPYILSGMLSMFSYACAVDAPPAAAVGETSQAQVTPAALVFGRISMWCGKVNVHAPLGGAWESDGDCVSGCNLDALDYCRKFWPDTGFAVEQTTTTEKPAGLWNQRGCLPVPDDYDGDIEYLCVP